MATLRFQRDVEFRFFHGPALYAALLDRLGNPPSFPRGLAVWASESGRVRYAAGDLYRFGLVVREGARPDVGEWRALLASPPRTPFGRTGGAPLGATFELVSFVDARNGEEATRRATRLGRAEVEAVAARLEPVERVELRFRSPVRVLRDQKSEVFDQHAADAGVILDRAVRVVAEWELPVGTPETPPLGLSLEANRLWRTDVTWPGKHLAASGGSLVLRAPGGLGDHAQALLLAGLLGIGKNSALGLGRFEVIGHPVVPGWPPPRGRTLLAAAADPAALDAAVAAVDDAGPAPGVDGVDRDTFLDQLGFERGRVARELAEADCRPAPLRGLLLRRPDGRYRPLAIPTQRDRFVQRAVLTVLSPAVDQLLDDASFAYRPGLSRRNAQDGVRRAYDEGYRWVFEGDIAAFFDEVRWDALETRLRALWADDPVVDLLLTWVKAPIRFDGREVPRDRGLPQGGVVSPLLANLYLDAFDEALDARGMRLVRYADDFLVLTRTREEAEAAHSAVVEELARLDLRLSPEKSAVRSFDEGFRFLGSLFCRTLVVDSPRARDRSGPEVVESLDAVRSDAGLLAALAEEAGWLRALGPEGPEELPERRWRAPLPPPDPDRRQVVVVDHTAKVSGRRNGLFVEREGEPPVLVAWHNVAGLVLVGGHWVLPSVFQQALRHRVPVSFHRRDGLPTGVLLPEGVRSPSERVRKQWRWMEAKEPVLACARALVEAKVHNTRLVLRRQRGDHDEGLRRLELYAKDALRAESVEALRGIEGQAGHTYFAAWPGLVGPRFRFPGRSGRGAGDPVNALLNLLYSLLFRRTWLHLVAAGLDPYAGLLHAPTGRHAALASDLMEPFRFLADRVVLDLVHRQRVRPEDFVHSEKGPWPCRIGEEALKVAVTVWEEALHREVAWGERKASFDRHLFHQARSLAAVIDGDRALPEVFRMKW